MRLCDAEASVGLGTLTARGYRPGYAIKIQGPNIEIG
jgi:hypothetical protein